LVEILFRLGERVAEPIARWYKTRRGKKRTEDIVRLGAGLKLFGDGAYGDAVPLLRAGLRAVDEPGVALSTQLLLAHCAAKTGKLAYAASLATNCLKRCRRDGYLELEFDLLLNLGAYYGPQQKYDEARASLEDALRIARRNADHAGEGAVLLNLANVNFDEGNIDEAQRQYEAALQLADSTGNWGRMGSCLIGLGRLAEGGSELGEAEELYRRSHELVVKAGDAVATSSALADIARMCRVRGRPQEAEELAQDAVRIAASTGSIHAQGEAAHALAEVFFEQGRLSDARTTFIRSRTLFRQLTDRVSEYRELGRLFDIDISQGDTRNAERWLRSLRTLAEARESLRIDGNIKMRTATLHLATGRLHEAGEMFRTAAMMHGLAQNVVDEAGARANLGVIAMSNGEWTVAERELEQALEVFRQLGLRRDEAGTLINLGISAGSQRQPGRAERLLTEGKQILLEMGASGPTLDTANAALTALAEHGRLAVRDWGSRASDPPQLA
jgi:tetratricopeptide (TPR) repeat protein